MIYTYFYLATVYRKHAAGLDAAADEAARYAADFLEAGIPVFSPVAYGHSVSKQSKGSSPGQFWDEVQLRFMQPADGLIVVQMDGWTVSEGIRGEIRWFREARRPIIYVGTQDPVGEVKRMEGV